MAEAGPSRALGTSVHCPYHPEGQLIEDHSAGDMICPECGLVVGDRYIGLLILILEIIPGCKIVTSTSSYFLYG